MINIPAEIAKRLGLSARSVEATIGLLDDGATIPFISRYCKEATGSLNEVDIREIEKLYGYFRELSRFSTGFSMITVRRFLRIKCVGW